MIGAAPVIERAGGEDAGYRHLGAIAGFSLLGPRAPPV